MHPVTRIVTVAFVLASAAGCADLKPLQGEVDSLKTQVGTLQSQVNAHVADRTDANAVARAQAEAAAAGKAAAAAQATANQALTAAQSAQAAVDATNEKIGRMFKKSVSK